MPRRRPRSAALLARRAGRTTSIARIAESLKSGERRAIWLGALALRSSRYSELRALARALARPPAPSFGELAEGGNAAGAYLAGAVPHRGAGGARARQRRAQCAADARAAAAGLPAAQYRALGRCGCSPARWRRWQRARCVVAVTPYASAEMKRVAQRAAAGRHLCRDLGHLRESGGPLAELWRAPRGRWAPRARRGRFCACSAICWIWPDFDYQSSEQVRDELKARVASARRRRARAPRMRAGACARRAARAGDSIVPMYQIDPVLRRAGAAAAHARRPRRAAASTEARRERARQTCGRRCRRTCTRPCSRWC